ncbi:hypothetical protein Tsubulata_021609 [Turnera subulata]|uniref:VOC domain-containing protein n=1 Tax=Turnera subulata TaxID=218843 RepID=A0A9Q0FYQ6_9ROSI|nr:hypothetical protein Tsubulata_021609 [Turnera subulata]
MKGFIAWKISVVLRVPSVEEAVNFYKQAFGAKECPFPSSPEQELIGIHATKLNILHEFPILITDCPLVPEFNPAALNLCLQVRGGQLADLEAAVTRAVKAGAIKEGELVLDPRPSMRLKDPFGIVWFLYIPSDDEISSDHRRKCLYLDESREKPPVEYEDDPNASYVSKLKILLKIPDPLKEEAVKFYSTAFGAGAPQFPTKNEIPSITSTHLELARNYYIMISGSTQNIDSTFGISLCAMTHPVEGLVERLKQGGAVLVGDIVYQDPIYKFRRMAKLRDPFGVVWFIYDVSFEERCVVFADFLDEVDEIDTPEFREILRLRQEAAREGRKWPAVGREYYFD